MTLQKIDELIVLMREFALNEIQVSDESGNYHLARNLADPTVPDIISARQSETVLGAGALAPLAADRMIVATTSGIFYRATSPGSAPLVEAGDKIAQGQHVCVIETMKMMNNICADQTGILKDVLVADGESVDVGQPLMALDAST